MTPTAAKTIQRPRSRGESDAAVVTRTTWEPRKELKIEQWVEFGRRFGVTARASQWWIGDWVRYGSQKWGEKYKDASGITGYDIQTLKNFAYVASRFNSSRRRDDLTWSHHEAVAGLATAEQDEWLTQAVQERLSVADLRIEVKARQKQRQQSPKASAKDSLDEHPKATVTCPNCGEQIMLGAATNGSVRAKAPGRAAPANSEAPPPDRGGSDSPQIVDGDPEEAGNLALTSK